MFEGKRRYQRNTKNKSDQSYYSQMKKTKSYHHPNTKKAYITVIETILDDSNKENETKSINNQHQDNNDEKEPESLSSFSLNDVSTECLADAFYFPKKLAKVYKLYASSTNVNERNDEVIDKAPSLPLRKYSGIKDIDSNNRIIEMNRQLTPVDYSNEKYSQCLLLQQQQQQQQCNIMMIPLQQQRKALELIKQEQMRIKDNTEILCIKIKINEDQYAMCKIRRYDDLFMTIKVFCEINQIDSILIRPLIVEVFRVLNLIYATINTHLSNKDINYLGIIRSVIE